MAEQTGARAGEARMDAGSLYREEIYTDRAAGTLRVLVPVKADGSADAARPTLFIGEAQILTNMGPLPISFEVDAKNLAEAIENYGEAAKAGVERAMRELQELRRQASSSIVSRRTIPPLSSSSALRNSSALAVPIAPLT